MHTHDYTVRLSDTDAAGMLYFAAALRIAHETYETFMTSIGFGLAHLLREGPCLLPIAHAEADYHAPCGLGDRLTVTLTVANIGEKAFTTSYILATGSGKTVATAILVHVALDPASRTATTIPAGLRIRLKQP